MKLTKDNIIHILLIFFLICLSCYTYKLYKQTKDQIVYIEEQAEEGALSMIYYQDEIDNLSKINKELYDSIKIFKNQIDYLVQFKYEKTYTTGKIETDKVKEVVHNADSIVKTYEYSNKNDTLSYILNVGAFEKPQWYSLDVKISDKFTIVNKAFEGFDKLDIVSDSNGKINDVTVLKKKEKINIFDNISIGPSMTMGYNFTTKEPEFILGVSITYDIKDLLWKK
jgi:hypothetical protein